MSASESQLTHSVSTMPVTLYSLLCDTSGQVAYLVTPGTNDFAVAPVQLASENLTGHSSALFNSDAHVKDSVPDTTQGENVVTGSTSSCPGNASQHVEITQYKAHKVFSSIQATLSADIVAFINSTCTLKPLSMICTACHVQMTVNTDSTSYVVTASQTDDLCLLEQSVTQLLSELQNQTFLMPSSCENSARHPTVPAAMVEKSFNGRNFLDIAEPVSLPEVGRKKKSTAETVVDDSKSIIACMTANNTRNLMKRSNKIQKRFADDAARYHSRLQQDIAGNSNSESVAVKQTIIPMSVACGDQSSLHSGECAEVLIKSNSTRQQLISQVYEMMAPYRYFCPECSFRSKRASQLKHHMLLHDRGVPVLVCPKCPFQTTRLNHLSRHKVQHHDKAAVACSVVGCHYRTSTKRLLHRHVLSRHNVSKLQQDRPFACQLTGCSYRASTEYFIRRHQVRHIAVGKATSQVESQSLPVDRFHCNRCGYDTTFRDKFLRHINTVHSNARPYLCDVCGRGFKRSDALSQHLVVHTDKSSRVYLHQCVTCGRKFRSLCHLNDHMTTHSTIKSFLCEQCGAKLKSRAAQRKHVQTIHTEPRSFICPVCDRPFNTAFAMRRHSRLHDNQIPYIGQSSLTGHQSAFSVSDLAKADSVRPFRNQKLSQLLSG